MSCRKKIPKDILSHSHNSSSGNSFYELGDYYLTENNLCGNFFFSLKINKSPGYDDISFNVLKKCFSGLCEPLKYLFNLPIEKGIFPDDLKIAKVTPIYKADDKSNLSNYRPTSVLSCFSKILERIMYNSLYQYLTENKILYLKQFSISILVSRQDTRLNMLSYN